MRAVRNATRRPWLLERLYEPSAARRCSVNWLDRTDSIGLIDLYAARQDAETGQALI